MKTTNKISVTLGLALALSAGTIETARAQGGGGGGGRGNYGGGGYASGGGRGSVVRLVTYSEVQQDLGLSEQQKEEVSKITRDFYDHERKLFAEFNAEAKRGPWGLDRINEAARQRVEQTRQDILRVLTPSQATRIEQISLQELGAEALFRPDVAKALNLSPGQRQKLTQISDQANQQIGASHRLRRPPFGGNPMGGVPFAQGQPAPGGSNASGQARAGAGTSIPKGPGSTREIIQESERRMLEEVLTPQRSTRGNNRPT